MHNLTMISLKIQLVVLLCGFSSQADGFIPPEPKLDLQAADATLLAAGMNPNGQVADTRRFIMLFAMADERKDIKREIKVLKELASIEIKPNACQLMKLAESVKRLKLLQDGDGISRALKDLAIETRDKLADICMLQLDHKEKSHELSHRESTQFGMSLPYIVCNYVGSRAGISQISELPYHDVYMVHLGILRPGAGAMRSFSSVYYSVARLMRTLDIDSYELDKLPKDNRYAYGCYLIWGKMLQLEGDIEKFIQSREEQNQYLLRKIESKLLIEPTEQNDRQFAHRQSRALGIREFFEPDLVSTFSLSSESPWAIATELMKLLKGACRVTDLDTEYMFRLVVNDFEWLLPVKQSTEALIVLCHSSVLSH